MGCGRTGSAVAMQLAGEGWDVTCIDDDETALARLGEWRGGFVVGHGMDLEVLERAGVVGMDAAVVATDGDNTNLVIGQVLQRRYEHRVRRRARPGPEARGVLRGARAPDGLPHQNGDRDTHGRRPLVRGRPPSGAGGGLMYAIVAGGGKVGANITRSLVRLGHEVTLIEQRRDRFEQLEAELGPIVLQGDATEIHVLERAGIARPPQIVLAVTGDDEDNIVISQLAKEGYGVPKAIARVNDPRNQAHFDALGITQTVCATSGLLGLVEHEVPEHGLVKLLELRGEGLELVELHVPPNAPAAGKRVAGISLPEGAKLVSLMRNGVGEIVRDETVIRPGDQIVAILKPGVEDRLRRAVVG